MRSLDAEIFVANEVDAESHPIGMFEAAPIDVSSGFAENRLYYPFAVELRAVESDTGALVHNYRTMVVRSDGALLSADLLPAPRGTRPDKRVLSLSDGTRIRGLPPPSPSGSWSFTSIKAFATWRRGLGPRPFRSPNHLLDAIESHLHHRVWLPNETFYTLISCFVMMTFAYQLFPALPILLALGPAASGKSELGEAVASLSANGVLAGQLRAAGMVRLLDESRGLLVLDDMDATGALSLDGDGEIAMALKTGYKRATSRKPLADRGGRIRMVDYFGPKFVTRTRLPGAVLGSRMITVPTEPRLTANLNSSTGLDDAEIADLRDELHCWGMANVAGLRRAFEEIGAGEGTRWDEIIRPLRAVASCSGSEVALKLEEALRSSPRQGL